jgi:hypothetical protein
LEKDDFWRVLSVLLMRVWSMRAGVLYSQFKKKPMKNTFFAGIHPIWGCLGGTNYKKWL